MTKKGDYSKDGAYWWNGTKWVKREDMTDEDMTYEENMNKEYPLRVGHYSHDRESMWNGYNWTSSGWDDFNFPVLDSYEEEWAVFWESDYRKECQQEIIDNFKFRRSDELWKQLYCLLKSRHTLRKLAEKARISANSPGGIAYENAKKRFEETVKNI